MPIVDIIKFYESLPDNWDEAAKRGTITKDRFEEMACEIFMKEVKAPYKRMYGITYSFEKWVANRHESYAKRTSGDMITHTCFVFDNHNAYNISKYFNGYMTEPVASIDGKQIEAKSYRIDTIQGLLNLDEFFLSQHVGKKKYLLDLSYWFPRYVMKEANPNTFEVINLEHPKLTEAAWVLRFGMEQ